MGLRVVDKVIDVGGGGADTDDLTPPLYYTRHIADYSLGRFIVHLAQARVRVQSSEHHTYISIRVCYGGLANQTQSATVAWQHSLCPVHSVCQPL